MQSDLCQPFAVCWDELSLNHSTKEDSFFNSARNPAHSGPLSTALCPLFLSWLLSPSRWLSSVCWLRPSPKRASIKSPFEDENGTGQLQTGAKQSFPIAPPPPMPVPICPISSAGRSREHCCGMQRQFLCTDAHRIDVSWFHRATLLDAPLPLPRCLLCHGESDCMTVSRAARAQVLMRRGFNNCFLFKVPIYLYLYPMQEMTVKVIGLHAETINSTPLGEEMCSEGIYFPAHSAVFLSSN